jgi:hypothetical protein
MVAPNANYTRIAAPVELLNRMGRVAARIECAQCGGHDEWQIPGRTPPPEALPKHFTQRGWILRKRPVCPVCNSSKPEKEIAVSNVATLKSAPANSNEARQARSAAVTALVTYFNPETGSYEDGWSDERIAKETGLSKDFVAKRREEDFGPIREPSEFAEVRAEAKALASEIGKLQEKLNAMAKRNGWSN